MVLSTRLQVQSNPPSFAFPLFPTNSTSPRRRCTIRQPINPAVVAPLRLSSSPLFLLSASAYPPSHSLSQSLNSDPNTIPKNQGNFNRNDSCNDEKKKTKRRRKPRPSYLDLTLQRWSRPVSSDRHSFPWQTHPLNSSSQESLNFSSPNSEDKPQPQLEVDIGEATSSVAEITVASSLPLNNLTTSREETEADSHLPSKTGGGTGKTSSDRPTALRNSICVISSASATPLSKSRPKPSDDSVANASAMPLTNSRPEPSDDSVAKLIVSYVTLPWERDWGTDANDKKQNELHGKSNTELAERTIPELELRRLRDAALRMKERMRVGPAGVTEAIVLAIHDKWKEEEVVKLRVEGPPSLNMKRTHQILEVHKLFQLACFAVCAY